jgi:ATP-binding cassette subfamily F protein uup
MSNLISCRDLSKSYGARTLFEGVSLSINEGDRIGVIGANGTGKTTLLRILAGDEAPDTGTIHRRKQVRVAQVPQESRFEPDESVLSIVARAAEIDDPSRVEEESERQVRVSIVLDQAGFTAPESQPAGKLSGGWQKRLAIAAALARDPDLLLLDEPTNHLDLQGILWLERLLSSSRLAHVVISHDRTFLEAVAGQIIEVDPRYPGSLFSAAGSYQEFLRRRQEYLTSRAQYRDSLANRVRRELEWLAHGPKARTSKAQFRVEEAHRLQAELTELKAQESTSTAGIELLGSGRKTKRLLVATGLGKSLGERRLISDLDLLLQPGQRLAVVGANGSGKTTLLRLLAGELEPDTGRLRLAPHLQVVYFDQGRDQLPPELSLRQALAGRSDTVIYRGRPIHVVTWASRFQFRADQLDQPLSELSGGEQARVHIARLMLRPADLLLLDEPTNDLDIATLEVLEESLSDFPGALVLVTHDRMLLDRVATLLLGLDGAGGATFYADIDQWQCAIESPSSRPRRTPGRERKRRPRRAGLTYLEKKEYEEMEATILSAEAELDRAQQQLDDPAVASDAERAHTAFLACQEARDRVDSLYRRWSYLEEKLQQAGQPAPRPGR